MKIDIKRLEKLADEGFLLKKDFIAGEECTLVVPKDIGVKWTEENMIFRSSIWNSAGELISPSFFKFFNFHEQPDLQPFSEDNGIDIVAKLDGSTLIISRYKGELIMRTRGTFDASKLELSGHEIAGFKEKYGEFFNTFFNLSEDYSLLFEWTTPHNTIVVNELETKIRLIGSIRHIDYSLYEQRNLDSLARWIGVERPRRFEFNSIAEMLDEVSKWEGCEGICVYYNDGQNIRKVKSDWYLRLHRLKSSISSIKFLADFWYNNGRLKPVETQEIIEKALDFELSQSAFKDLQKIYTSYVSIVDELYQALSEVKSLTERKDIAICLQKKYKNVMSLVFSHLDGKEITSERYCKMILDRI